MTWFWLEKVDISRFPPFDPWPIVTFCEQYIDVGEEFGKQFWSLKARPAIDISKFWKHVTLMYNFSPNCPIAIPTTSRSVFRWDLMFCSVFYHWNKRIWWVDFSQKKVDNSCCPCFWIPNLLLLLSVILVSELWLQTLLNFVGHDILGNLQNSPKSKKLRQKCNKEKWFWATKTTYIAILIVISII